MHLRSRLIALIVSAVVGVATLVLGSEARAADGRDLPPGSSVCTDRVHTTGRVWAYGAAALAVPVTWTVRMSGSIDGPEVELLRTTAWELPSVTVVAAQPGSFFHRACVHNTADRVAIFRLGFGPYPVPGAVQGVGPHSAVLGAGGRACGEWIAGWEAASARLVGTSNLPVSFSARVTDGDAALLREDPLGAGTSVDLPLSLNVAEAYEICVTNTSGGAATISWEVQPL
ncbi:hypothetical protein ACFP2T_10650 [Plantactinospora solaniradicis]|uniref:Secreted protein n=1 Tax=Plantactinospora solaniradicis TaxID=1723736 RepID=A0ABW1K6K4_9ACTN